MVHTLPDTHHTRTVMLYKIEMKKSIYLLLLVTTTANAQFDADSIKTNFENVKHMPYICEGDFQIGKFGCGDSLFWEVVIQKENVISGLIELLNDTTETMVYFPNYGGKMRIADVAEIALGEIIQPLPNPNDFFDIEPMDGSQWMANINWLQRSVENRIKYQNAISNWYKENKSSLIWILSNTFMCGDLGGEHPNKGHYITN